MILSMLCRKSVAATPHEGLLWQVPAGTHERPAGALIAKSGCAFPEEVEEAGSHGGGRRHYRYPPQLPVQSCLL
jgi:hypothetical protein